MDCREIFLKSFLLRIPVLGFFLLSFLRDHSNSITSSLCSSADTGSPVYCNDNRVHNKHQANRERERESERLTEELN
jgi:hypothetical protein